MKKVIIMNSRNYNGANWVRIDLHLHTPGVKSFDLPSGINIESGEDKEKIAKQYVKKLKDANIKVAAITDYNGIRKGWYESIKQEAEKENINIFPGIELSFDEGKHGLHVLAIFEKDCDIDGINRFIHSLDKNPQEPLVTGREHRDIIPKSNSKDAIKEIKDKFPCVIIIPHPEYTNGLFKSYQPNQIADYLKLADGIEYISDKAKTSVISTGKINKDFFEKFAIIENSDPKSLEEIGTKKRNDKFRSTYYKLSSFTISALKMALHDPEIRVKTYECPLFFHNRISKVVINGSTFLRDIEIEYNPELNTFIGGRGVGKSAIIEAMRYAMDLPIYADKSSRIDFVESVVGSGGEISVFIERYYGEVKKDFKIKRVIGKDSEIFEDGVKTGLSIQSLFEEAKYPIIIGQKELYHLSITPSFQLQLIDEIIGAKIQHAQRDFERSIGPLKEKGRKLLAFKEKVRKKEEYEQKLKEVEAEIKVYKDLGVEEKLKKWTDILDDDEKLKEAIEKVDGTKEKQFSFFDEFASELYYIETNLKTGKSENKLILEKAAEEISQIKKAFELSKKQLSERIDRSRKVIESLHTEWLEKKKEVEGGIREIKKELGEKGLKPDVLERLTRERAKLIPLIEELTRVEKEIEKSDSEREKLKDEIKEKRHEIFSIRKKQIDKINDAMKGRLKIEVKYEEAKDRFTENLTELLRGSKVSNNAITAIVNAPNKVTDGLLLSQYIKKGKLEEEFNLTPAMSNRILEWFKDPERLYELETLFPEDKIEIFLKINEEYKVIDKLSIGQKATALLLLLFAQEDRILVLDQPEEDLDNRFIYEDAVKILREIKGKRQLIIATHNANITVLGDSELILVLDNKNNRCVIDNRGSIDKEDIKADVKIIMEGGEEAFRIRAEKYGV
ncbi:MAG: AAA family ATPase [Nitrospirota bacterium]|nr:AAA family ATPase [Nitrospirota bacterium]